MFDKEMMMALMRKEANDAVIKQVKDGKLSLENDEINIIPPFVAANFVVNPQLFEVLELLNELIMEDKTMEKEYVSFFINKVRELANQGLDEAQF